MTDFSRLQSSGHNIFGRGEPQHQSDTNNDRSPYSIIDHAAFEAYTKLRQIAKEHNCEDSLVIPQLVIVGETSVGKSMLVQNFLGFPCSFSETNIATRCPVAYRLRYNSSLADNEIRFIQPSDLRPEELADHLKAYMKEIEKKSGFRVEPYVIEIQSKHYTDFEILDVPGLVGGDDDLKRREAVERITEQYVRNPKFSIVQLKSTEQLKSNAYGIRCIQDLCTRNPAKYDQSLPPRHDYRNQTITIQTFFDTFMTHNTSATDANENLEGQIQDFGETYFVNMIFDGYSFSKHGFEHNVQYLQNLPRLEKRLVDEWISRVNNAEEFEKFNENDYRKLIGIDVAKTQIQQLWLKSFRLALPKLQTVIQDHLQNSTLKHDAAVRKLEQQDPNTVRECYRKYIDDFRRTLQIYIAQKGEIFTAFPVDKSATTYHQLELEYNNNWKRRYQLDWRAHLTCEQMTEKLRSKMKTDQEQNGLLTTLNSKLNGSRHFERLRRIFAYMILSFEPERPSDDLIETAEGHIYGGLNDYENLPKAVREIVHKLVNETFLLGICWLTQMITFITDMFAKNVKKHLLCNKHHQLKSHYKFLYAVDFEYHEIIRTLMRDAICFIRQARNCYTSYITHDLTLRLKKLTFSIPPEINHETYNQKIEGLHIVSKAEVADDSSSPSLSSLTSTMSALSGAANLAATIAPSPLTISAAATASGLVFKAATIADIFRLIPKQDILKSIFGSESYLTNNRNPQTGNHYENGRNTIKEIYTAVCGQILYSIETSFNTHVCMKLDEFHTLKPMSKLSLRDRILLMSDAEIIEISNLQLDDVLKEIDDSRKETNDLNDALDLIKIAIRQMATNPTSNSTTAGTTFTTTPTKQEELRQRRHQARNKMAQKQQRELEKNISRRLPPQITTATNHRDINEKFSVSDIGNTRIANEIEHQLFLSTDKISAYELLLKVLREHDREDLEYGLFEDESLEQDKPNPKVQQHIDIDANQLDEEDEDIQFESAHHKAHTHYSYAYESNKSNSRKPASAIRTVRASSTARLSRDNEFDTHVAISNSSSTTTANDRRSQIKYANSESAPDDTSDEYADPD